MYNAIPLQRYQKLSTAELNKRIASTDWRAMYQQPDAKSVFQLLSDLFKDVEQLNSHKNWRVKWVSTELLKRIIKNY